MHKSRVRWVLSWMIWAVVLPSGAAHAQPPADEPSERERNARSRSDWLVRVDEHVAAIEREETRNGPHSEALVPDLVSLALVYQERAAHVLAIESLNRAWQIKRVNAGLYTLEQVPIIRQLITSEQARGNAPAVTELEGELLRLARRNPEDLRSVDILHDIADRRLAVYRRHLDGDMPPEIRISFQMAGGPAGATMSNSARAAMRLRQARSLYASAIGTLLESELYMSDELLELEEKLISTYYLQATADDGSARFHEGLYRLGRESHERMVWYAAVRSGRPVDIARELVELADWHLLFSHNGLALEHYKEAYALLEEHDVEGAIVEALFRPEAPVALPSFESEPIEFGTAVRAEGYVDVSLRLSKFGKARQVEILETAPAVTEDAADSVRRFLSYSRFRPRLAGVDDVDTRRFPVRYYIGGEPTASRSDAAP